MSSEHDPLELAPLFEGGEEWLPILKPVIEADESASMLIGPGRFAGIVPVRELTFQALKPNPPHKWKRLAFGQTLFSRATPAPGMNLFDNVLGRRSRRTF